MKTSSHAQRAAFADTVEALLEGEPKRRRPRQAYFDKAVAAACLGEVWLVKVYACPPLTYEQVEAAAQLVFDT